MSCCGPLRRRRTWHNKIRDGHYYVHRGGSRRFNRQYVLHFRFSTTQWRYHHPELTELLLVRMIVHWLFRFLLVVRRIHTMVYSTQPGCYVTRANRLRCQSLTLVTFRHLANFHWARCGLPFNIFLLRHHSHIRSSWRADLSVRSAVNNLVSLPWSNKTVVLYWTRMMELQLIVYQLLIVVVIALVCYLQYLLRLLFLSLHR